MPDAVAILDPKQKNCNYPFKDLCGCGIGFKLIHALSLERGLSLETILPYLDLVAMAIAADIVPILGENRILTHYGLEQIRDQPREGIKQFISGLKRKLNVSDLIFVIDTVREQIAIKEANKLNIPIAAIIDTNCDPEGITYPIPGNDDSTKSIKLYCDLVSQAALDGISIQSQKVQEETQDKKEKPQKETVSKEDNKSKELSDTPKTDDGKEIENLEENNDKSKSEEKD